jgi:transcriptional regulator with XRE-family HTH domain
MPTDDPWKPQLEALGAFIRAQRRMADLSLREMAAVAKVSNAYLSQVERGQHQPSVRVLRAIAQSLGVPVDQLLAQAGLGTPRPDAAAPDSPDSPAGHEACTTEAVIRADPALTDDQREALLRVYRSFVGGPPHRSAD